MGVDETVSALLVRLRKVRRVWPEFLIALAVLALCMYHVFEWHYGERFAILTAQRDDYKEKLGGATPDQVAQQIADLKKEVKDLHPRSQRHLTDDQKERLIAYLTALAPEIKAISVFVEASGEPQRFANEFFLVFKLAGIGTIPFSTSPNAADEKGIRVGLVDQDKPSELGQKFISALRRSGLQVGTTRWGSDYWTPPAPPDAKNDFDLVIYADQAPANRLTC